VPYSLSSFLVVSAVLFCLGVYTVISRRNAIGILMGIELVLNAAGLNFVAFSRFLRAPADTAGLLGGQIFALFIIAVAAAEVAVALAIVLSLYSGMKTIDVEQFKRLQG
jgi:NADH:ubiquinone oxidoreductase subunit K